MSMLDRVFGPCLRNWVWQNETGHQKYIDYLPKRKWRYNDENLMNELTDNNSWDIKDLADDELLHSNAPANVKLRLHDNVFVNPLNATEDRNDQKMEAPEELSKVVDHQTHDTVGETLHSVDTSEVDINLNNMNLVTNEKAEEEARRSTFIDNATAAIPPEVESE